LKPGSRSAVAIGGPNLSIVPPCFGQTGVKSGAEATFISRKSPARRDAVTSD
jgi:hypothetical protein